MKPKTFDEVHAVTREGKAVFVDRASGAWLRTNHVGYDVLLLCDGTRELPEIVQAVAERYGVPADLIREDVEAFVASVRDEGLLLAEGDRPPDPQVAAAHEPNTVWFHLTRRCNLNCVHCYAGGDVDQPHELSIDEVNATLAQVAEFEPYLVYVTGGEPLMRSDLERLDGHGLRLRLITNGTLIGEHNVSMLARLFAEVQVSVDGPDAATHRLVRPRCNFDAVVRALDLLGQQPFERRIVSCTATRLNYERVPDMVRWAYERGWSLFLSRLVPTGNATMRLYLEPDEYFALVARCRTIVREIQGTGEKLDKNFFFEAACMPYTRVWLRNTRVNCGIGGAVVSIDASGDLYPCPLLHQAAFKVGNLRDASFAQLVAVAQARYASITADDLQGCNTCYIKRICGGGCRALSIHSGRGLMGADPYCSVTRDTIEEAFWVA